VHYIFYSVFVALLNKCGFSENIIIVDERVCWKQDNIVIKGVFHCVYVHKAVLKIGVNF